MIEANYVLQLQLPLLRCYCTGDIISLVCTDVEADGGGISSQIQEKKLLRMGGRAVFLYSIQVIFLGNNNEWIKQKNPISFMLFIS